MSEMLCRILSGHFTCGVVFLNDQVIEAAPIVRYMMGWTFGRVRRYCEVKHWRFETPNQGIDRNLPLWRVPRQRTANRE